MEGFCEYGKEPSGSIKFREFFDPLKNCSLLKKGSAVWSSSFLFTVYFTVCFTNTISSNYKQDASAKEFNS